MIGQSTPTLSTNRPTRLPEVLIVAEQKEVALESNRLTNAVATTELKGKELSTRPNRRVGDALKRMPGVYMGGPPSENKDIRLRGLDKEFTRTAFDGLQVPDGGEKREMQVDRVPTALIGEISIVRNPSAEYESDGLAGRVELKSRRIPEKFTGELKFGGGGRSSINNLLWDGSAYFGGPANDWLGMQGVVSFSEDPLFKNREEQEYRANGTLKKNKSEFEDKKIRATDLFFDARISYSAGEIHLKPIFLRQQEIKDKVKDEKDLTKPAGTDDTRETENEVKTKQTSGLAATHEHRWQSGAKLEHTLAYYRTAEDMGLKTKDAFKEAAGVLTFDKRELESEDKADETWNLGNKLTIPLESPLRQELKLGSSFRFRERFRDKTKIEIKSTGAVTDKTTPKDTYFLQEDYYAGFAQNEVWLTETFSLLPGVRLEHVELTSRDLVQPAANRTFTDFNPSLHSLWRVRDDLSLRAGLSRSVNRPKFDELSPFEQEDATKFTIGNPGLEPARSWNVDVGADYSRPDFFLGVNLFHKWVEGVIEEVDTGIDKSGKDVFQVENVGDGWVRGIELEQRLGFSWTETVALEGLTLWANQTLLDSLLRENSGRERRFKEQPALLVNFGFDYELRPSRTVFTLAAGHVVERTTHEANGDVKRLAAEWTLDAAVRQRLANGLYAYVEVENITGTVRQETNFKANGESVKKMESGGRTVLFGLQLEF